MTFRDYYVDVDAHGRGTGSPVGRRLIMTLYDNPANFSLIQQVGDHDTNLARWLQDQELDSEWVGPRRFHVNGRQLDRGHYGHDYIRFRLDVGLAMPVRQNAEEAIPLRLLPIPRGRTHMRRFFHPHRMPRRQRRLGISRWIDHAVIPGNCVYFYDLDALPDRSLLTGKSGQARARRAAATTMPEPGSSTVQTANANKVDPDRSPWNGMGQGHWEAWLSRNWMDAIEDDQDETTYRYFTEVVCASQYGLEGIQSSTLLNLLDPPTIVQEQAEGIYEYFWREEFNRIPVPAINVRRGNDGEPEFQVRDHSEFGTSEAAFKAVLGADVGNSPESWQRFERIRLRSFALYTAMISDVRRAFHAIRIFELAMGRFGRMGVLGATTTGGEDERGSFAVLATQDRMNLYTAEKIRELFEQGEWSKGILDAFKANNCQPKVGSFLLGSLGMTQGTYPTGDAASVDPFARPDQRKVWWEEIRERAEEVDPGDAKDEKSGHDHDLIMTVRELGDFYRLFDETDFNADDPDFEESKDYRRWTRTLRAFGRLCSGSWPDLGQHEPLEAGPARSKSMVAPDKIEELREDFENGILPATRRLVVHREGPREEMDDTDDQMRKSIRNSVWLLYGIAPTLPALIHCHLMGIVRDAKLNHDYLAQNNAVASYLQFQEEKRKANPKYRLAVPDLAGCTPELTLDELRPSCEIAAVVKRTYDKVYEKLREWTDLIASLALVLRYIRVKYIHIHFVLLLEDYSRGAGKARSGEQEASGPDIVVDGLRDLLTRLFGESASTAESQNAIIARLRELFMGEKYQTEALSSHLSILPDVSSSTMFGVNWIEDTILSLNDSKRLRVPLELTVDTLRRWGGRSQVERGEDLTGILQAEGIFAETEQWLWATNCCLRKFYQEYVVHCETERETLADLMDLPKRRG